MEHNCQCGNRGNGKRHCHGQGHGKKRRLFEERYSLYLLNNPIPSFQSDEEFDNWLNTEDGAKYSENIDLIWSGIEREFPWGGKRNCAGRKKTCAKKIPFNRRINEDVLNILKLYSEKHQISETEALEKAIMLLEEA